LIDEALINKNENDFIQYTNEFKQLEAFLSEKIRLESLIIKGLFPTLK
ncbi:IDEAL domain-containing protein, partial [Ralstonia insidiosa]|nr:IDEAL domain-containing protein [Ralstonia insidiosa]